MLVGKRVVHTHPIIVLCTDQSSHELMREAWNGLSGFQLTMFDEAHVTATKPLAAPCVSRTMHAYTELLVAYTNALGVPFVGAALHDDLLVLLHQKCVPQPSLPDVANTVLSRVSEDTLATIRKYCAANATNSNLREFSLVICKPDESPLYPPVEPTERVNTNMKRNVRVRKERWKKYRSDLHSYEKKESHRCCKREML